jgi:VanZ family protein
VRGIAKTFAIDNVTLMHSIQALFRILNWCCVTLLAELSLLPAQDLVRTGIPGQVEHFVAYAESASIAIAGYRQRGAARIIGSVWDFAAVLDYLQHFSPGRYRSNADFAGSALEAFLGGLATALLVGRLWKGASSDVA